VDVGVGDHVRVEFFDEANHVVVVLDALVHLDGLVRIVDCDEQSKRKFEILFIENQLINRHCVKHTGLANI